MKKSILIILSILSLIACDTEVKVSSTNENDWSKRKATLPLSDDLENGTTYLSVYSEIYSQTEHKKHDLVVTASIRNTNLKDSIFINTATYYDTNGQAIRTYFDKTIFIAPLGTVEIIIDETDKTGGSGANFIFDWSIKKGLNEPLIEAVMISTYGQQGLSFTTKGVRVK